MCAQDAALQMQEPPASITAAVAKSPEREKLLGQIGTGVKVVDEQKKILRQAPRDAILDIKPTGELYIAGYHWRQVLNDAFDPFGWGMALGAPLMDVHEGTQDKGRSILYREVFLLVSRCTRCMRSLSHCACGGPYERTCVSTAIGAQEYHPTNARLSYDDAAEGAGTNGLSRCCKVFDIYGKIWEPQWAQAARDRLGVKVFVTQWDNKQNAFWRLLTAPPLTGETGVCQDSPNKHLYAAQVSRQDKQPVTHARSADRQEPPATSSPASAPSGTHQTKPINEPPSVGEKVLTVRPVAYTRDDNTKGTFFVIQTVHGDTVKEYITDDDATAKAVQALQARGQRMIPITTEPRKTAKGSRTVLVEFQGVTA